MPYDSSFPSTRESAWFFCDDGMWKDWTKENPPMAPVTVAFSTQQSQPCMAIPTGQFDVFDPAGAVVGSQEVQMTDSCTGTANVNTMDGKYLSFNFAISNGELQVEHWNDDTQTNERFTGKVMGDGFHWSTGYSSKRSGSACMAIPTGLFDVFDPAGAIVGSQEVHMTGPCTGTANVNTMDGKYLSFNFAISNGELQV